MAKIRLLPSQCEVSGPGGARLMDIFEESSSGPRFGCGQGACGSCLIEVVDSPESLTPITEQEAILLESLGAKSDERLACQCRVLGDVTVRII